MIMNMDNLAHIEDIENFLNGSHAVAYSIAANKADRYKWICKTLSKHQYIELSKCDKGTITQFICKISGYSRHLYRTKIMRPSPEALFFQSCLAA
jgi:hypothetical protein